MSLQSVLSDLTMRMLFPIPLTQTCVLIGRKSAVMQSGAREQSAAQHHQDQVADCWLHKKSRQRHSCVYISGAEAEWMNNSRFLRITSHRNCDGLHTSTPTKKAKTLLFFSRSSSISTEIEDILTKHHKLASVTLGLRQTGCVASIPCSWTKYLYLSWK